MTKITITDEALQVDKFSTTDEDIVRFFQDVEEDNLEEKLLYALRLGVISLKSSNAAENVDFIEKRFSELQHEFEDELEDFFGENGKLLNQVLDPQTEGTPMQILKRTMEEEFEELRKEIFGEEVREAERAMSTRKGFDFEDQLDEMLGDITSVTNDVHHHTGEEDGELDRKVGDFVVDVQPINKRIVIEAKDEKHVSYPDIKDQLEAALENRDADYAIFVSRKHNSLPTTKVGWFKEVEGNKLILGLSEDGEDERMAYEILKIGYKWARLRLFQEQRLAEGTINAGDVQDSMKSVEDSIDRFQNVRRKLTNIKQTADDIEDVLSEIEGEIEGELDNVMSELATIKEEK